MRLAPGISLMLALVATAQRAEAYQAVRHSGLQARWIGQDGQDWTGPGPSVGPDGLQDVHIQLTGLAAKVGVKAIRIEGPGSSRWEFGKNPTLNSNAEFVRDAKNQARGELYFQPDRDLDGLPIKVIVAYDDDTFDAARAVARACDAGLPMPAYPIPEFTEGVLKAKWLGQDGGGGGSPGDVRVAIAGLPAGVSVVGAVLTDAVRGTWAYRGNDQVAIVAEPSDFPLAVKPGDDGKSLDLYFRPYRDESQATMTLRVIAADGRNLLVNFPGETCDLGLTAPRPDPTTIEARPGDDLQALVDQYGTVVLTEGTYRLGRTLVLNRPVTVRSAGKATLLFDQAPTERPWSAAIKVHRSHTTLDGFAVRFAGPVRWNNEISWGPAVIGMTDNLDPAQDERRINLTFTHLDLEIPPVVNPGGWVEAVRLMRLIRATSGVIAGNVLRGGTIEFFQGPWRVVDNDFRGTVPGTYSHGVFAGHGTHDLIVRDNRARDTDPRGKTWRFLVLSWQGANDVVERNRSDGLGAREGDTVPWTNEPEIIVTEAYHVKYEGKLMGLAGDGKVLRTGRPQSTPARTGDVVSLLRGPTAGEWRRIVQVIDPTTYLVDRPIPAGTTAVSISSGFVGEVFRENHIDMRGGRKSFGIVFVGNHFGTQVINNHVLGGECGFKMTACPSESPVMWGWTHAPFLGGVIEGNILEDSLTAAILGLEHDPRYIKSNKGRAYMAVRIDHNVVRWSEPFLKRLGREKIAPAGLILGYSPSNDPGELMVRAVRNRLESSRGELFVPSLVIHAADYNSQPMVNRRYRLPAAATASAGANPDATSR